MSVFILLSKVHIVEFGEIEHWCNSSKSSTSNKIVETVELIASVVMLILTGCNTNENNQQTNTAPFVGGAEGLAIMYQPQAPPDEIYDSGQSVFEFRDSGIGSDDPFYRTSPSTSGQ